MSPSLTIHALRDLPIIREGDDLATLIVRSAGDGGIGILAGDVLVIAQKVVSKAEGRFVDLREVQPGQRATDIAATVDKDPRLVELILSESRAVIRQAPGVLLTEHRCGWMMANAGIDASNVSESGDDNIVLLLPENADRSATDIRAKIAELCGEEIGVVINDSFGRPWRLGTTGVAIGAAGVPSLWDRRGETDLFGRELRVSQQGVADELAAAASLLQGQGREGLPAVIIRGYVPEADSPPPSRPATDLIRTAGEDLFR